MSAIRHDGWRIQLAFGLALAGLVGSLHAAASFTDQMRLKKAGRPNIIFILADDLGYGDLGCYGQTRIRTPNLDRLAAEGMRFTQTYAGSTVCAPSRCVLLTGLHTGHTRVRGNDKTPLEPGDFTVAEMLRQAGYLTCAIGKWGLGRENTPGHPNLQGFDEWLGYLDQTHAHDYYPDHLWRNQERRDLPQNAGGKRGLWTPDLFTRSATNYIRSYHKYPFFLYLAYTQPHANNELGRQTGNGMEVPDDRPYSGEDWPQAEKNKAAMITRLDADVGRILATLQAFEIDDETLILFSSDNGPHREGGVDPAFFNSSGSLRGFKRDLYEGGIRVPAIAWWKGHVPPGTTNAFPWMFCDFMPTAADIAGVQGPPRIDGISILPALLGEDMSQTNRMLYWEFHEKGFHQAVRTGPWKAVRHGTDSPLELYHLEKDPAETTDVASQQPAVVARIEDYLRKARSEPVQTAPATAQ